MENLLVNTNLQQSSGSALPQKTAASKLFSSLPSPPTSEAAGTQASALPLLPKS